MTERIDTKALIEHYFDWLRNNTVLRGLENDWTEITTPFLDRHNDCLQIYVKPDGAGIRLTDDGHILGDLKMSGFEPDSPRRQSILREMLSGFGVREIDGRLEVLSDRMKFSQHKHDLIQAMLAVNDMFYLSSPYASSLFFEDASNWLGRLGVRYTEKVMFKGKSGFHYHFFGIIPKSAERPERIVQPINHPDKNTATHLIFEWNDTREQRGGDTILYPILNDTEQAVRSEIVSAFSEYGITCIPWSKRDDYGRLLVS